jgi:DNA-binding transcriptional LysR family regulator
VHLRGLDLNLLIALDALLSEKNVTRAAERMNISQPGMSSALQKLRRHFSDRLLERIGRRLELTPRARALAEPVKNILFGIRALTEEADLFDPATARRVFRLCTTTFCSDVLAVPVIKHLEKAAPGVNVQFDDLLADTFARLVDGRADLAITIPQRLLTEPINLDKPLSSVDLFSDHLVLALATGNNEVGDTISLDELCALPYAETRFGSLTVSVGERAWRRQPRQPQVRAWFPNFQLTLDAVAHTRMIAIVPSKLVAMRKEIRVRTLPIPFEVPTLNERAYWHPRNDQDPGHRWFRGVLQSIAQNLGLGQTGVGAARKHRRRAPRRRQS